MVLQTVATVTLPAITDTVVFIAPIRTVIHFVTTDVAFGKASPISALMVTSVAVVERSANRAAAVFTNKVFTDAVINNGLNEELIGKIVWEMFNLKNINFKFGRKIAFFCYYLNFSFPNTKVYFIKVVRITIIVYLAFNFNLKLGWASVWARVVKCNQNRPRVICGYALDLRYVRLGRGCCDIKWF